MNNMNNKTTSTWALSRSSRILLCSMQCTIHIEFTTYKFWSKKVEILGLVKVLKDSLVLPVMHSESTTNKTNIFGNFWTKIQKPLGLFHGPQGRLCANQPTFLANFENLKRHLKMTTERQQKINKSPTRQKPEYTKPTTTWTYYCI